ncbi:hypothetical protein BC834DRAFT_974523 [Gloeopeniophorella convolvens]|nr:hypothetical protein BC834DRAFT_974523 [Gloeopeniophorella convolvens]
MSFRPEAEDWNSSAVAQKFRGAVTGVYLTRRHVNDPHQPLENSLALAAETARAIASWRLLPSIPPAMHGFHPDFILNGMERRRTWQHLLADMRRTIARLEHSCGVGCVAITFRGEHKPMHRWLRAADLDMTKQMEMFCSETFSEFPDIYFAALKDIQMICETQLGISFIRDFRIRAKQQGCFAPGVEQDQLPTRSVIYSSPSSEPHNGATPYWPPPQHSQEHATNGPDIAALASDFSSFIRVEQTMLDSPSSTNASSGHLRMHTPNVPNSLHNTSRGAGEQLFGLPLYLVDLLHALNASSSAYQAIQYIRNEVASPEKVEEALSSLGFNRGTVKAILALMA